MLKSLSFVSRCIALAAVLLISGCGLQAAAVQAAEPVSLPAGFPAPARWINHLTKDLMPFWMLPAAQGTPVGNFPSVRCNNGSAVNYAAPCDEVNNGYLLLRRTSVVALSRQTYGYCMAFHMTGNTAYLRLAKAGVAYLRSHALDRINGGSHSYRNDLTGAWDDAYKLRTAQELAYALQGLSCYHYITRDPAVLAEIVAAKNFIFKNYWNTALGMFQWQLEDGNDAKALDRMLVAQLDQLAYMPLIAADLPPEKKKIWIAQIARIADIIKTKFYAPDSKLFFTRANAPEDLNLATSSTDFGHNAKILWNLQLIGRMANRPDLVSFSKQHTAGLLAKAFMAFPGTWATGYNAGGSVNGEKSWWIHAELDQLTSVSAMSKPNHTLRLAQAYDYWFKFFVDHEHGEVWTSLAAGGNQLSGLTAKSWFWKNAFHSLEHAFFGYVTSSKLMNKPVVLYYAFQKPPSPATLRPYCFTGKLSSLVPRPPAAGITVYRARFTNIGF